MANRIAAIALVVGAALVIPAATATAGSLPRAKAAVQGPLVRATLSGKAAGARLPASFMGFSTEYQGVQRFTGIPATGINPVFAQLADNITGAGSGPPLLRVGGGSTDDSIWNPNGQPKPPGISYNIDQGWVDSVKPFLAGTGIPLILGLNLGLDDPAVAASWAQAAGGAFGSSIRAFEIGNEPDIYPQHPYGRDASGQERFVRPATYSFRRYLSEFNRFARALRAVRPARPLAGPSTCCGKPFLDANRFLKAAGRSVRLLTYHYYPLNNCGAKASDPRHPSLSLLLSDKALIDPALFFQEAAARARRYHAGLRLTETNSASCGGVDGISNTLGSALWGTDWLFVLWAVGASGADFHVGPSTFASYAPVSLGYDQGRFGAEARPLYYGMLLFARATANRARLLPRVTTTAKVRRGANVKVWGTRSGSTGRVIVINKDPSASGNVVVRARGGVGTLTRLTGSALEAKSGVTLAGQSVATPSYDGQLGGPEMKEQILAHGGSYRFSLPPASAALLEVSSLRR